MKTMLRSVLASVIVAAMLVFVLSTGVNVGVTLKSPCGVTQETFSVLQSITVLVDTGGGRGTGVLVTRRLGKELHTYVWTAGHVVKRGQKPNGTFRDVTVIQELRQGGLLTGTRTVSATVISYSDPERGDDLALLEINVPNWTSVSAVFGATAVLPVGTPLIHVGCTLGLYNSTSLGIVSQTDRFLTGLPKSFEQTSCMGYPGSSGGGVYSYDGRCIGLLVRGAGPGLNMIVPMRRLRAWAAKMGVLWAIDPAVPVPTAVVRLPVKLTDTPPENDAGTVPLTPLSPGGSK